MRISGFENVISIEEFEYCSEVNEHEQCRFVCYAREKNVDSLLKLNDSDCTYEDERFSFNGHIREVTVSRDISGNRIEVISVGKTYMYDEDIHFRIFQNAEKTLSDILSKLGSMSDVKHEGEKDRVIEGIVIQNGITDWDFAKSLSRMLCENIFPGENTFIARSGKEQVELAEDECIDYKYTIGRNCDRLFCRVNRNLKMGTVVEFNGKKLVVCKKKYVLEKEQYYFEYFLREVKEEVNDIVIENDVLLEAIVSDNNDPDKKGRVKVSFNIDVMEDSMGDSPIWIERGCFYATKGYGAVFIPAVDDKVIVKITNGKAIVLGSLRTEAYNESFQSQNNKYFLLDEKVFVEYKEGCFTITNKENNVNVSDKQITINMGDKNQVVIESGKVCIQIDKSAVEIASDIKASSGKIIVEANNDASMSATTVNIKGKSGVNIN